MSEKKAQSKLSPLLAKVMTDETLKAQLLENPMEVLKAEGIAPPVGLEVKVLENTDKVFHLVLPAKSTELTDEELDAVAGGQGWPMLYPS